MIQFVLKWIRIFFKGLFQIKNNESEDTVLAYRELESQKSFPRIFKV